MEDPDWRKLSDSFQESIDKSGNDTQLKEVTFSRAMKIMWFGSEDGINTPKKTSGPYIPAGIPDYVPHSNLFNSLDFYDWYTNHEDPEYARKWVIENIIIPYYPFLLEDYEN